MFKRPFIETPNERAAFEYGIRLAASVAEDYDQTNSHPYLVSECILSKLNVLKRKPKRNPAAGKIARQPASTREKVASADHASKE